MFTGTSEVLMLRPTHRMGTILAFRVAPVSDVILMLRWISAFACYAWLECRSVKSVGGGHIQIEKKESTSPFYRSLSMLLQERTEVTEFADFFIPLVRTEINIPFETSMCSVRLLQCLNRTMLLLLSPHGSVSLHTEGALNNVIQ